jgi:hypothetical protein
MVIGADASRGSSAAMRLRRCGTPWGCLVVVQFTLTEVPQWKLESLFGAGIKFIELPEFQSDLRFICYCQSI